VSQVSNRPTGRPRALIIAGPNGSGKTTFAGRFLTGEWASETFINADLIAAGLSPFKPEDAAVKAMRLTAEMIRSCVKARKDFAVESTLSGRTYVRLIKEWKKAGFIVTVVYLRIGPIELAIKRVRVRVARGGHDVPDEVIRRRFIQGWHNFRDIYRLMADVWQIYDTRRLVPLKIAPKEPVTSSSPENGDMADTYPAMLRAAQHAREVARRTGTPLVVNRRGEVTEIPSDKIRDLPKKLLRPLQERTE
jgi:predicted ABC-type ATPase